MKLEFFKYHGTGNDFILLDNREGKFPPGKALVALLCHRRYGIGADGLILLNREPGFDFGMRYFNSDGLESTMCGNGGRCIIAFADFLSVTHGLARFLATDGEHAGTILSVDGDRSRVRLSIRDVSGIVMNDNDYIIDTGSPHLVRFVENVSRVDVVSEGRRLRSLEMFSPSGININFVEIMDNRIYVRTYERGVEDETLSCGTGVTAAALAFADKTGLKHGKVGISAPGGNLSIEFNRADGIFRDIWLEGPVVKVFRGFTEI